MIVCPVCEHAQSAGSECEVCGKAFSRAVARELPVERVPGLEATRLEDPSTGASASAPVMRLPDLEGTQLTSGPDLPPAPPVPELEPTTLQAVAANVPVQRLPDVELHREETPASDRTAPPVPGAPVVCRYCRNVQAVGNLCDRCGMRLSRYMGPSDNAGAAGAVFLAASAKGGDGPVVLHACGVRTPSGARCTSCGAFVPDAS